VEKDVDAAKTKNTDRALAVTHMASVVDCWALDRLSFGLRLLTTAKTPEATDGTGLGINVRHLDIVQRSEIGCGLRWLRS
jgi:hypothetical protein